MKTTTLSEDNLISQCLVQIFRANDSDSVVEDLEKYFDSSRILKIRATVRLGRTGDFEEAEKYLSAEEIKTIREKK